MSLVGTFKGSNLKIPSSYKRHQEKPKKEKKNGNLYAKPIFKQIGFIFLV